MKSKTLGKTIIENWRGTIQYLLGSGDEQNPKFAAQIHIFIHTILSQYWTNSLISGN